MRIKSFYFLIFLLLFIPLFSRTAVLAEEKTVVTEEDGRECIARAKVLLANLGLKIDRDIYIRVEERDAVKTHFSNSGRSASNVIALYNPHSPECIFVTKGYPESVTTLFCVHELCHAWQTTNLPIHDIALEEGFAYWIQGQAAILMGRVDLAYRTAYCSGDPLECEVYLYLTKLYKQGGMSTVMQYMKQAVKFEKNK